MGWALRLSKTQGTAGDWKCSVSHAKRAQATARRADLHSCNCCEKVEDSEGKARSLPVYLTRVASQMGNIGWIGSSALCSQ